MKLLNKTQSKHSILSKRGVDKQIFLSDVYKKRTQAKKHQLDVPQFGRSMVEMLGVLAIIGVLSVGGIAGYSKAMFKHKINQTLDTISQIIARAIELDVANYNNDGFYTEAANSLGFECDYNGRSCNMPFGVYYINFDPIAKRITLEIDDIDVSHKVCSEFLTSQFYLNIPDDWWYPRGAVFAYGDGREYFYGRSDEAIALGAKPDVTATDISRVCDLCKGGCRVVLSIKDDDIRS